MKTLTCPKQQQQRWLRLPLLGVILLPKLIAMQLTADEEYQDEQAKNTMLLFLLQIEELVRIMNAILAEQQQQQEERYPRIPQRQQWDRKYHHRRHHARTHPP